MAIGKKYRLALLYSDRGSHLHYTQTIDVGKS